MIVKSQIATAEILLERMARIGMEFLPVVWQHERIYVPRGFRSGMNQPRIGLRTEVKVANQPAEYILYLKRHIEDSGVDFVFSTPVKKYTEATGIIHQLGFEKLAEISRQRRTMWLDENTLVQLDEVEGLDGAFVKIEAELQEGEPVDALRQELLLTLKTLQLETMLVQTYGEMINSNLIQPYYIP